MKVQLKHPLAIRWNHWINFPALTIMIWSGLMIYWANPASLLPGKWLEDLGLAQRLGEGMAWHFTFGLIFIINGLAYTGFLVFSGQWRYLFPDRRTFRDAFFVVLAEFRLYKGSAPAFRKYNGAQRFAYTGVLLLGIAASITGLAIYKPLQLNWILQLLGGYSWVRQEHFYITVAFVLFFFLHVTQVMAAGWNQFQAMVTGMEKVDDEK